MESLSVLGQLPKEEELGVGRVKMHFLFQCIDCSLSLFHQIVYPLPPQKKRSQVSFSQI